MANEKRLIDANALLEDFGEEPMVWNDSEAEIQERNDWHRYKGIVESQTTVDAVEVVHGKWEMGVDEGDYEYGTCSACGYNEYNAFCCLLPHNYCPNCGADMRGETE